MGLVDIHCHILPGVDDGPKDPDEAYEVIHGLEMLGFTDLYPTPHQRVGFWTPKEEEIKESWELIRVYLEEKESKVTIHRPAAENMWDELFLERQKGWRIPSFPGEKAFLIEFLPDMVPSLLHEQMFQFCLAGRLPVIAHIERYRVVTKNLDRLADLGRSAVLLVNLSSLGGISGWSVKRISRNLVRRGLVHAVSSDIHNVQDLEYCRTGASWIRNTLGEDAFQLLLLDNPQRILKGEIPEW